ncbi:MAG: SDR family NAD(P)-dependent oxidoreductase [Kiritimatiellae bacterium]|nr:SDR family NAD(P)-dependent oxidoreductase [Kiritimatiellia bacterium]MDD5523256.1 SDR family NAD(P)-dependent oxidoreductase [Kiritimatiellia bacterium]
MEISFKGKTVLVTGAAGAIGKGIARDFCVNGGKVFVTDLSQAGVEATVKELQKLGQCQGLAGDVANEADVIKIVDAAKNAFDGKVDVLVNVAGIVGQGAVENLTVDEWEKMFAVNCRGSFLFIKHVVPMMKQNKYGKIINFSSKSGKTGSALMSHYSAAKAAIIGLTQSLAYELADYKINVNCVCPGITENTGVWSNVSAGYIKNLNLPREEVVKKFSEKVPLKRLAAIKDVVTITSFLGSEGSDYMTGQAINITGGREMH